MQLKSTTARGTYPLSLQSTAFNVDYFAAGHRYYRDGCAASCMDWQSGNGQRYSTGDTWGSIGAWYSGGWHDWRAKEYIAKVQNEMWNRRAWTSPWF